VIFASLVDDPGDPELTEDAAPPPPEFVDACKRLPLGKNAADHDTPRQRLFDFIERLVLWESTDDEEVLSTARELIHLSTEVDPPPLLDPFAGGGSIPLEAQRLGLETYASDLNPIAVMINKALIEIPPRFMDQPPANPEDYDKAGGGSSWKDAAGLAADVRYYGKWIRDRAWDQIGHLYPKLNDETVATWIWVRTVQSPNPVVDTYVPLVSSFWLSKRKGSEAWIETSADVDTQDYQFIVRHSTPDNKREIAAGTKVGRATFRCLLSDALISGEYINQEANAGRMHKRPLAVVTEGKVAPHLTVVG
jgi:putative DNA methylase